MKLKLLIDLEVMRLGLIPFTVDASKVIAGWSEDRKIRHFRKFRKLARKAARSWAEREMKMWGTHRSEYSFGLTRRERREWIDRRTKILFSPNAPKDELGNATLSGRPLQEWRFFKRRVLVKNWIERKVRMQQKKLRARNENML